MDTSYPAAEKLKSKKIIDLLFTKGKSVGKYPLRLVYIQHDFEENVPLKIAVSVSKKHFKHAVDRNYFKRVLRECYRLNKAILIEHIDTKYCLMFFYQTKDKLTYTEINEKTIQLFEKFIKTIKEEEKN
ncbi:ribonuclease P protein component [Flavobacterium phycosphaerae]|uniref:ribonuclease P protein component n=1 Tax=Flavobacterium phycosphaerae TaxID=2697515 RepID=UPI001389F57C|nr:ribonuclease P protein component [Flavobacterium phycosphaerae]